MQQNKYSNKNFFKDGFFETEVLVNMKSAKFIRSCTNINNRDHLKEFFNSKGKNIPLNKTIMICLGLRESFIAILKKSGNDIQSNISTAKVFKHYLKNLPIKDVLREDAEHLSGTLKAIKKFNLNNIEILFISLFQTVIFKTYQGSIKSALKRKGIALKVSEPEKKIQDEEIPITITNNKIF